MRGASRPSAFKPAVPVLEQNAQVVPQLRELHKPGFGRFQFLGRERTHLAAGKAALVTFAEDDRELGERESEGERAPNEKHPGEGRVRIDPVVVGRTRRLRENAHAFIVPQGVGADPGPSRQLSGSDDHLKGNYRAWNAFEGQEKSLRFPPDLVTTRMEGRLFLSEDIRNGPEVARILEHRGDDCPATGPGTSLSWLAISVLDHCCIE